MVGYRRPSAKHPHLVKPSPPRHPHAKSVSRMPSFKLFTKPSTGHNLYFVLSGQYLNGEKGTGVSFTITRICSPGVEAHDESKSTIRTESVIKGTP